MTAEDVADFLASCIAECEADGYQQQRNTDENRDLHEAGVDWGWASPTEMTVMVGKERFRVKVTKMRVSPNTEV